MHYYYILEHFDQLQKKRPSEQWMLFCLLHLSQKEQEFCAWYLTFCFQPLLLLQSMIVIIQMLTWQAPLSMMTFLQELMIATHYAPQTVHCSPGSGDCGRPDAQIVWLGQPLHAEVFPASALLVPGQPNRTLENNVSTRRPIATCKTMWGIDVHVIVSRKLLWQSSIHNLQGTGMLSPGYCHYIRSCLGNYNPCPRAITWSQELFMAIVLL